MIYWSCLPDSLSLGNHLESVKYLEQVKEQGGLALFYVLREALEQSSPDYSLENPVESNLEASHLQKAITLHAQNPS